MVKRPIYTIDTWCFQKLVANLFCVQEPLLSFDVDFDKNVFVVMKWKLFHKYLQYKRGNRAQGVSFGGIMNYFEI